MRFLASTRQLVSVRFVSGCVSVVTVLLFWYFATERIGWIPSLYFPSPRDLLSTIVQLRETLLLHSALTFARVLVGFAAGSLLGFIVGLLMSRFDVVFGALDPLVEALRPVPPIALVPFFILWFGIGPLGKILLAGLGCFMVLLIATVEATHNVRPIFIDAARTLGAKEDYIYRTIIVPSILPELVGAARVSLALAFGLMIAAELMGAQAGLGYMIMVARRNLNTSTILVGIVVIGIEARIADRLLSALSDRVTRWSERRDRPRLSPPIGNRTL